MAKSMEDMIKDPKEFAKVFAAVSGTVAVLGASSTAALVRILLMKAIEIQQEMQ